MNAYTKIVAVLLLSSMQIFCQSDPEITSKDIESHLDYLASDNLKGRFSGSKEIYEAAVYLAGQLQSYGLQPVFKTSDLSNSGSNDDASKLVRLIEWELKSPGYLQPFSFIQDIKLSGQNSMTINYAGMSGNLEYLKVDTLIFNKDYVPAPFSGSGMAGANIVFAGYGITAPKLNYDDYKGIDVTGKIVLVLRGSPEYDNPHSEYDKFSSLRTKSSLAKEKGAVGIIFVNGYLPKDDDDKFIKFKYDRAAGIKDFPVVQISREHADKLFKSQKLDFGKYQQMLKDSNKTAPFEFNMVTADIYTGVEEINTVCHNVAAILEGNDPDLKNEYIVVGAHYDHLGMGTEGSLYKGIEEQIHNGADDNASGTAGVIELAQKFASQKDKLKRSIIFVLFSGEELGLLGSAHFANNSPVPLEKIAVMINLDMVGRLNEEKLLTIYGAGTSSGWKEIINSKNSYGFKLALNDEGYGPSDQTSFYAKNIPVLFFFTGVHTDYHRPSDDADLINYSGEENILKYIYDITLAVDGIKEKPDYINIPRKETSGGWKVYVGTIPDYSSTSEGFRLTGVSPGSPADKGGLKGGDIMIQFGAKKIANIYDYVAALQDHVPGDEVEVTVKRDKEEKKFKIVLGAK